MKETIENAVIALLSGITSCKPNTKEILWEDESECPITVEYLGDEKAIVRRYYKNGHN